MKVSEFEVGKVYPYREIEEVISNAFEDEIDDYEYGEEYLGSNAIHIRYHNDKDNIIDVWLIAHSNTSQFHYKCVYKE
jgi:hypothetical protein